MQQNLTRRNFLAAASTAAAAIAATTTSLAAESGGSGGNGPMRNPRSTRLPFKTRPKRQMAAFARGEAKKGTESGQTILVVCVKSVGPEGFEPPTKRL
jgi:hypothetical protein